MKKSKLVLNRKLAHLLALFVLEGTIKHTVVVVTVGSSIILSSYKPYELHNDQHGKICPWFQS